MIWTRLYDGSSIGAISERRLMTRISTRVRIAAGRAMAKFSRNLSFISQPWPWQAAMVVSEIKERLSPNMAPPMTDAMHSGIDTPEAAATATPMGVMRVMVPTEVPMAVETKQLTTNRTATAKRAGMMDSMK